MTSAHRKKEPAGNLPAQRLRVLVVAGPDESGAGGRASAGKLAGALATRHDVVLALPFISQESDRRFATVYYTGRNIGMLACDSDFVVFGPAAASVQEKLFGRGPIAAIPEASLMTGDLESGRPLPQEAERLQREDTALEPDELFVMRPLPERPEHPGWSYYAARFRFHLKSGGLRQALRRKARMLKRRMGRRR